ncbi:Sterile alpha motif (SAM) domain-containing protein [Raphanus sativus]|uniref:Uncharacterized protein LOC108856296 n=1 Tax=Raphanus sativus TaxID=3726 RepID=A0A6J0NLD4_RAPSA|nr:uncharacterized protein LOC108856296 [Raphanus sativus]KAJ4893407.1 Sterile alpha motif (SAM) domain-containing protein [Raphanus sativus]
MARQRPKQLEPNRIGSSKLGFDGEEEDGWVFVKKQRVIVVLPSLPLPEPSFTLEKPPPAASHPQVELRRDSVVVAADNNNQETARVVVVPSLPPPEQFVSQKPETCRSLVELRDVIAADIHKTTPLHTVVPSLSLPEPFVFQKPATSPVHTMLPYVPVPETSQTQAEFRDDKHEASLVHTVVPSFPGTERITLLKPAASQSRGDSRAEEEKRKASLVHTVMMPSLPVTEHTPLQKPAAWRSQAEFRSKETPKAKLAHTMVVPSGPVNERVIALQKPTTSKSQAEETLKGPLLSVTDHRSLQKPVASQSQAALRAKETLKATRVQAVPPSLPVLEYCTLQKKPATWQSQAQETRKAPLANTVVVSSLPVNLQKPATSQSQANLRAKETPKATPVQAVVPPLPVLDYCTLQKPARDFVSDAQETADFQAVDKPERAVDRRKAPPPGPRRSLQEPERRLAIQRNRRASHNKPVRFPRVMCSSVAMDNEKLRVVNLEKKVEKAGGLNEWVGSIGLGREFERMLRGQRMSKFQMANLTMEKLKQMGALAVGPRRKLIHAIRCVYHPHCLRASFN